MFKLKSDFSPTGDQPQAIEKLVAGVRCGLKNQVLLGVTGSGKTFTMANVIERLQMPALIISHNKTLAAQLYQEMREFFPENAVSYFVSYYDYYQPEAYIPQKDLYISKEAQINELIDKLRLQATTNILTRQDTIVVASVSCIYNIGSPREFGRYVIEKKVGDKADLYDLTFELARLHYVRSEFEFKRGTFRVRGDVLDIFPAYDDFGFRVYFSSSKIEKIQAFEPLSGKILYDAQKLVVYPAKQYMTDPARFEEIEAKIREDLAKEAEELKKQGKKMEAERLVKRVNYDLEMIREVGYVNGIENYSRYFDGRKPGEPPFTLLDYFQEAYGDRWLVFIDESHMTVPQLRAMYRGDYSRKKTLVEYGFRLKAAFDNRPLKFEEFYPIPPHIIYVSATPDEWEIEKSKVKSLPEPERSTVRGTPYHGEVSGTGRAPYRAEGSGTGQMSNLDDNCKKELQKFEHTGVVEQLVRPTGIADPEVEVRPAGNEVQDVLKEIRERVKRGEKVLITTLTKRTAEDLSEYLQEKGVRAYYLHSDIDTLERTDILDNLRKGKFDVLVGVNLLREGLDLPEVTLVAILDADKEGFLRSKTSLIQTMGRAARNVRGKVILYADEITRSMKEALKEIERRRRYQLEYNRKHNIKPKTVYKPIRPRIIEEGEELDFVFERKREESEEEFLKRIKPEALTAYDKKKLIKKLKKLMKKAADEMNFELAIKYRDTIYKLKS